MPFSTAPRPEPQRLPCSALAVAVLIFCSGLLGFSIGRDLPQTCPIATPRNG